MVERSTRQSFSLKWVLIGAGWTLFAVFFASEAVVSRAYAGKSLQLGQMLAVWLLCALLWFAVTPPMLGLARRFPLERRQWLVSSLIHVAAAAALAFLLLAVYVLLASSVGLELSRDSFAVAYRRQLVVSFHSEFLTYWMVIGLVHVHDYYRKYRERELRAAQLETRLAQAQLDALKMQLHPHFLFNTLNSISVLMTEDVKAARRMLTSLSGLLRASLESVGSHEVSLKEELEFLKNYLEIEQTRFQDRLSVRMEIAPTTLDARVPNLILQPLVENAIRHGIAPHAKPGLVEICAERRNGVIELRVRDNGSGLGAAFPEKLMKGIGIANTRERLKQLYGTDHRFEMQDAAGGGLEVTITIPFRDSSVGDRAR